MTDSTITTFIDVRARDAYSAEFKKVASEGKRAAQDVGTSFKTVAKSGITDAVNEIRSLVRAYGLIKAGKFLIGLIEDWHEVAVKTAEARRHLETYLALRGGGQLKDTLIGVRDTIAAIKGLGMPAASAMAMLGDQFKLTSGQIEGAAKDAQFLTENFAAFKDKPVEAFHALAQAINESFDALSKGTGLDMSQPGALGAITKQRLILEAQRELLLLESKKFLPDTLGGGEFGSSGGGINPEWLKESEEILQRIKDIRDSMGGGLDALDPLGGGKSPSEDRKIRQERIDDMRELREEMRMTEDVATDLGDATGDALADVASGAEHGAEAFRNFTADLIRMIARLISEFIALAIARSLAGAGSGAAYRTSLGNEPVPPSALPSGSGAGDGGGPQAMRAGLGLGGGGGGNTFITINANDAASFEAQLTRSRRHSGNLMMERNQSSRAFRRNFGNRSR